MASSISSDVCRAPRAGESGNPSAGRGVFMRLGFLRGALAPFRGAARQSPPPKVNDVERCIARIDAAAAEMLGQGSMIYYKISDFMERALLLSGRSAAGALPRGRPIANLAEVEFRVFSQWGEDGIIEWLVNHVAVPNTRFVEFGVENFQEANCRFLLLNRNWKGFVMDGSPAHIAGLHDEALFWKHDLTATAAFVSAENIDSLLADNGFAGPLGLLSIDVDGNDYWVWRAATAVDPAIVICEYNPILGDARAVAVPYDPGFTRFAAHPSGLYFGCSIAALRHLAEQRGYAFVGTNSNGINAFFVRNDLAAPVLGLLRDIVAFPSRHRDSRGDDGRLSYASGTARFDLIRHLPVVDVVSGETIALESIAAPYSDAWLRGMA